MNQSARRVTVLGGSRIPFARQNGPYAKASNQDMLTATVDALVSRFDLDGAHRSVFEMLGHRSELEPCVRLAMSAPGRGHLYAEHPFCPAILCQSS